MKASPIVVRLYGQRFITQTIRYSFGEDTNRRYYYYRKPLPHIAHTRISVFILLVCACVRVPQSLTTSNPSEIQYCMGSRCLLNSRHCIYGSTYPHPNQIKGHTIPIGNQHAHTHTHSLSHHYYSSPRVLPPSSLVGSCTKSITPGLPLSRFPFPPRSPPHRWPSKN